MSKNDLTETIMNMPVCYRCGYVDINSESNLDTEEISVCPDCGEHTLMRIETMMDMLNEQYLNSDRNTEERYDEFDDLYSIDEDEASDYC